VFTCGATALIGLILGLVAMSKIRRSKGALCGEGLALAGTVVSGIFLLMLPIFAGMLLPALARAKEKAQTIACVDKMKQLALAEVMYEGANQNHFTPAATWCDALKPYTGGSTKMFQCPAGDAAQPCGYAFNAKLGGLDTAKVSPDTVLLFESDAGWNASGGLELVRRPSRHGVFVVAFVDGHVEQVSESRLAALRWAP
jgi:prepilin-type processing-associated H-X9-DG protein